MIEPRLLLIGAVVAVGILHTLVPDHWVPITLLARQEKWTTPQTARVAFGAGFGHTASTLLIGFVVWVAGVAVAERFGHLISTISSLALIGFGGWIAVSSLREMRRGHHDHAVAADDDRPFEPSGDPAPRPMARNSRMALLLILGSSPMVEGIPAFFAAAKFGVGLIVLMSVAFAVSTIATYVLLCIYSARALRRFSFGPLERYGEVLSGTIVAIVGIAFMIWPIT